MSTATHPPLTAPPLDDVGRWLMAQDAEARRLYRLYPEAFRNVDVPASWKVAKDMSSPRQDAATPAGGRGEG